MTEQFSLTPPMDANDPIALHRHPLRGLAGMLAAEPRERRKILHAVYARVKIPPPLGERLRMGDPRQIAALKDYEYDLAEQIRRIEDDDTEELEREWDITLQATASRRVTVFARDRDEAEEKAVDGECIHEESWEHEDVFVEHVWEPVGAER